MLKVRINIRCIIIERLIKDPFAPIKSVAAQIMPIIFRQPERFPIGIWRSVAAALDKMERQKGANTDDEDD